MRVQSRQINLPAKPMVAWIEATLRRYREAPTLAEFLADFPLSDSGWQRLPGWVSPAWQSHAKVFLVNRVPGVPLQRFGIREDWFDARWRPLYGKFTRGEMRALTLMDTCLITYQAMSDASVIIHELVHTVQWECLGYGFLPQYLSGVMLHGYEACPLEEQAFKHQRRFASGRGPYDVDEAVKYELGVSDEPEDDFPRVDARAVSPAEIVAAARGLCGARFRHSGRDPESGLDCGGLVLLSLQRAGCVGELNYRPFPYPTFETVRRFLGAAGEEVPSSKTGAGDVALFEGMHGRPHMGVVTESDPLTMVHATRDRGVVEDPIEAYPMEMIAAFRPTQACPHNS